MKHRDLINPHELIPYTYPQTQCLAWTANHEHAVFDLDDEIHQAAVYVWIGIPRSAEVVFSEDRIFCYGKHHGTGEWVLKEITRGRIPLVNNNPFDPRKQNAASNTAVSVFPQNREELATVAS